MYILGFIVIGFILYQAVIIAHKKQYPHRYKDEYTPSKDFINLLIMHQLINQRKENTLTNFLDMLNIDNEFDNTAYSTERLERVINEITTLINEIKEMLEEATEQQVLELRQLEYAMFKLKNRTVVGSKPTDNGDRVVDNNDNTINNE